MFSLLTLFYVCLFKMKYRPTRRNHMIFRPLKFAQKKCIIRNSLKKFQLPVRFFFFSNRNKYKHTFVRPIDVHTVFRVGNSDTDVRYGSIVSRCDIDGVFGSNDKVFAINNHLFPPNNNI